MNEADPPRLSQRLRVFVAIPVPHSAVHEFAAVQDRLRRVAAKQRIELRLTPKHQFHLTLAFLGNVEVTQLRRIFEITLATTRACPQCTLRPLGLVALPSASHARVIAIALEESSGRLTSFVSSLHSGLRRAGCELQYRDLHAHVTVARMRVAQRASEMAAEDVTAVSPILAREVVVFQSVLNPTGAEYHRLLSVEFGFP